MARDWSFEQHVEPYITASASNLTTTYVPGARDTGTTVGGMRVYEMPANGYEAVTVAPLTVGDHGVSASGAWPGSRVDMIVCPCNTPGDFPQPCGIHNPRLVETQTYTWTGTELRLWEPPRAPFAVGVVPQIGWKEKRRE